MCGKKKPGKRSGDADRQLSPLEEMLAQRSQPMLGLCYYALRHGHRKDFPCREFLQKLNAEATTMEELADYYGAQKNECWFAYREIIAAEKLFTLVIYDMHHLQHAVDRYRLLETGGELSTATRRVNKKLKRALIHICRDLTEKAKKLGIIDGYVDTDFARCEEPDFELQLTADRSVRHVSRVGETVVYLATQFLNLSEDRQVEELLKPRNPSEYTKIIPEVINEEKCRLVEAFFHNLQSMYDTYIFESDLEGQNRNLTYLRGHISMIYHLMQNATALVHYYVRHMSKLSRTISQKVDFPLSPEEILSIVFDYLFLYARRYLASAVHLCRSMIKSYSVEKSITVPIPNYRGFHVRPSTLIAKIVAHYGSSVRMILNDHEYNAGSPLELFRANEEINAMKRRYIADFLSKKTELQRPVPRDREQCRKELQMVFLELMKEEKLIIYEPDLPFDEVEIMENETMAELTNRCIKHFQSLAKVDVSGKFTVTFEGDNRALNDLKLLAENGYGEDRFGNNLVLTEELSYLRR
jgi:hypothetical protein